MKRSILKVLGRYESRMIVPTVDMHCHFVNFHQETDGFRFNGIEDNAYGVIDSMDAANIDKSVIFGLPVKKKWEHFEPVRPGYYLGDNSRCTYYYASDEIVAYHYEQLPQYDKERIAPTLCSFDPTDLSCIEYVEEMFEKYDFWKGIGELLLRHDDLTNLTIGEVARINHPALEEVFDFCVRKSLPILVHQNSTNVGSSLPSQAPEGFTYNHELEEVLEIYGGCLDIVWAHCGVSMRVEHDLYQIMVREYLERYPRLHVDLSWVVYDNTLCDKDGEPKQSWVYDLILPYADRIMIGSDMTGHFGHLPETMARYNKLLSVLPEPERSMIARNNAIDLYF